MKVWNKDVDDCCLCPYLGNYSMNEGAYCKFSKKDIEDINIIPKHCPFTQQITKEVIEGFGFTKLPEYFSASSAYLLETDKLFFPYSRGYKINYLIESHSDNTFIIFKFRYIDNVRYEDLVAGSISIFMGTINNPIELEFILRSIGVVE